jgi:GNAT superfamily N-acetyltransferase
MKPRLDFRSVEVFRPYANEFPEELLSAEQMSDTSIAAWAAAEMVRIAKLDGYIAGIYALDRTSDAHWFHLHGVIVAHPQRHRGLGTWLTGHAIGVAESKGGRHLTLPCAGGSRCFAHMGFVPHDGSLRFDLIPE